VKLLADTANSIIEEAKKDDCECCGILLADPLAPSVGRWVYPAPNRATRRKQSRFVLDPATHLRVVELEAEGRVVVVGYYHSHPTSPAEPSPDDIDRALSGVTYLIAGLEGRTWTLRAWRKVGEEFVEEPIELEMGEWHRPLQKSWAAGRRCAGSAMRENSYPVPPTRPRW